MKPSEVAVEMRLVGNLPAESQFSKKLTNVNVKFSWISKL